ncbi:cytochrome P450 [Amycolatopsis sp. NPDC006131]|uniref:cytochrome P450 n=1 Tax=Amycolatopsis sp. NPDC006131 TaxID=3156731 RepID=UPI0033A7CD97
MRLDPLAEHDLFAIHDHYHRLRAASPVVHSPEFGGFWAVLAHREVRQVLSDPALFINSVQNVVPKVRAAGRRPPLHLDPPEHTVYRRALAPLFRSERTAALEPPVRALVGDLVADLVARGRFDACELTYRVPSFTVARWMNIPDAEIGAVRDTADAYNRAFQEGDDDGLRRSSGELYEIARTLVARRRADPLDPDEDPPSALLAARDGGEPLPDELVVGTIRQLLPASMIGASVTIASCIAHLASDTALQEHLRRNPDEIPAAIPELLRLYSPYRGFARTAVRDVELGGQRIRAGEPIALVFTAANRDPAVFPEPDRFHAGRPSGDNIVFGSGPHRCAGAGLGRMEITVTLRELLARTRLFTVDGPIGMTRWPEFGPRSLPLRVVAR